MASPEIENDIPPELLTSLEDMCADMVDLQELILTVARAAESLPYSLAPDYSEPLN